MGIIVDTIWVSIVSIIPGLNVPKWLNVFRCLACLHLIVYLLFLDWELIACSRQSEMGLKSALWELRIENSLGGRVDLGTSSQVVILRALTLGPFQFVESKPSAPNQEREDKQWIEDKQGNEIHLFV